MAVGGCSIGATVALTHVADVVVEFSKVMSKIRCRQVVHLPHLPTDEKLSVLRDARHPPPQAQLQSHCRLVKQALEDALLLRCRFHPDLGSAWGSLSKLSAPSVAAIPTGNKAKLSAV